MDDWLTAHRIDEITAALHQRLAPGRVLHILGATHAAVEMAFRWDVDPSKALAAGLLHDIAKEDDSAYQRERVELSREGMDPEYVDHPAVWHALAGAVIAREDFGLRSGEVERAIRLHPTGDADMTALERIVFLADYVEPTRDWEGVSALRELARRDLRAAADSAVLTKTKFVQLSGRPLHPCSERALQEALARGASTNPASPRARGKEKETD